MSGCNYGIAYGSGYTISGTVSGSSSDFRFALANGAANSGLTITVKSGASLGSPPSFTDRNVDSYNSYQYVACEDYGGTVGHHQTFWANGDTIRNTSIVRGGGASSSIEVVPQTGCNANNFVPIMEWTEFDVPASEQTRTIYFYGEGWSGFPTAAQLYFEAEYLNAGSGTTHATATSSQTLSNNSEWTAFSVTFTPGQAGTVRYRAYLKKYEASAKVYVDNMLVTA